MSAQGSCIEQCWHSATQLTGPSISHGAKGSTGGAWPSGGLDEVAVEGDGGNAPFDRQRVRIEYP